MARSKNIVVIDPEEFIRQLLGEYFEELGYEVKAVARVSDGLEIISAGNVEVALIDTGSASDRNYLDAVDRLRVARPGLKVVLITGYPTLDGVINALRHGVYDIVVKPFRLEDLKETVDRACQPSVESDVENQLRGRIRLLEELLQKNGIKIPGGKSTLKGPADKQSDSPYGIGDDPVGSVSIINDSDAIND